MSDFAHVEDALIRSVLFWHRHIICDQWWIEQRTCLLWGE